MGLSDSEKEEDSAEDYKYMEVEEGVDYERRFWSILEGPDEEKAWWDAIERLRKEDPKFARKVSCCLQSAGMLGTTNMQVSMTHMQVEEKRQAEGVDAPVQAAATSQMGQVAIVIAVLVDLLLDIPQISNSEHKALAYVVDEDKDLAEYPVSAMVPGLVV